MAVTMLLYDKTTQLFGSGQCLVGNVYKVCLLSATSSTYIASHTSLSQVLAASTEVSGNGWTAGGETLASVAVNTITTNDAAFVASNISKTASAGPIGPAQAAVIANTSLGGSPPLAFINFGESKQADTGTDFKINWNANGIITFTYT